jgi:AraC-like DNA-binding protein
MERQLFLPIVANCPYFCFAESAGWYKEVPEHHVDRAFGELRLFNFHLVVGGKGYVEWGGKTYTVSAGDGFLFFPDQEQRYYSSKDEPWEVRWMHFYGKGLAAYFTELGFHRAPLWTFSGWEQLEKDQHRLLTELEEHRLLRPSVVSEHTYRILAGIVERGAPLTSRVNREHIQVLSALLPEMEAESPTPFILKEWAERAGMSVYSFCRLFKKTTGQTPLEFVTLCRLQSAKQLLLEQPGWTVAEIARRTGYGQASYFNRKFMESEGMTPTDYRRIMGLRGGTGRFRPTLT